MNFRQTSLAALAHAVVTVAALAVWGVIAGQAGTQMLDSITQPQVAQEDGAEWDCRVTGNRVCGVPGTDGAHVYLVCHDVAGRPVLVVGAPEQCAR